ncbi:MAG: phytanoyl-CoA dioxygenase family protein [Gemmatimonadaceae bacterium]|nr:phytanoyl-CoA dioxygenase family protein [Gemmatimonadaceae bacterium]
MEQAVEQYERDGYCIADEQVAPDDVLAKALRGMAAVRDGSFDTGLPPTAHPGYDPAVLCKIDNPHRSDTGLHGLVTCPQVGRQVAAMTGSRRVQVWASQLLIKPPGSEAAGHVGWHQDRQYWRMWQTDEGLFTAWIALSEVGPASGPMLFVRGSHRWGFLDRGNFFAKDQHKLREEIAVPAGESWEEVPALLPLGGLSVHHCLTYHGSNANLSDSARWSLAVHLRDERALPVPGDQGYYTAHLDDPRICPVMYEA